MEYTSILAQGVEILLLLKIVHQSGRLSATVGYHDTRITKLEGKKNVSISPEFSAQR